VLAAEDDGATVGPAAYGAWLLDRVRDRSLAEIAGVAGVPAGTIAGLLAPNGDGRRHHERTVRKIARACGDDPDSIAALAGLPIAVARRHFRLISRHALTASRLVWQRGGKV
jgi:hypothetical protein